MTNLIEKAAQRLSQLRDAGADVPPAAVSAAALAAAPDMPEAALDASQSERVELDLHALETAGFVVPNGPRTRRADEFRLIKRPLILNAMGKGAAPVPNGNLIMITSALPGEGKSFSSLNLAMSIAAELDHTVLLVDADVARPSQPRMLGLSANRKGLLDVLDGSAQMPEAIVRTSVTKLSVMLSGTPRANATEMLGSESMSRLLDEMARRYSDRIIIFDSPPLLPTTESRVLASHMGQLVLVVNAGRTLQSQVLSALATVQSTPVRMMLLNKAVGAQSAEYGYGYGYGYGYSYGYGQGPAHSPSTSGT